MNVSDYEEFCKAGRVYKQEDSLAYTALGLAGEAGEYCEKVKKYMRGDREFDSVAAANELGDVLWYLTNAADHIGFSLSEVMLMNMEKLRARQEAGTVKGSGDNR